ncbi:MAG: zeta toxin family protein [Candidatus Roizmanbacteria bacterium]
MTVYFMIGYPGSGKSTYAQAILDDGGEGCVKLDGDALKTATNIRDALIKALKEGKSVIIDATNMTLARRTPLFEAIKSLPKTQQPTEIIGVWCDLDLETSYLRNKEREKPVSKIAYYKLRKDFVEPALSEGFDLIIKVE